MPPSNRGVCYGFEVHSDIEFEYLRPGSGQVLNVCEGNSIGAPRLSEPIQEWSEIPGKRERIRLGRVTNGYGIQIGAEHWFQLEQLSVPRIVMSTTRDPRLRELMLWTTPAALSIATRGDIPLHAATVEVGGRAVLITAPSGVGKSTTAAAFLARGHRVLADDLSCVSLGEVTQVLPGPAVVRARRDSVSQELKSSTYIASYDGTKADLALNASSRGTGDPVPLAGIVFLRPGGRMSATRTQASTAIRDLLAMAFYLPTEQSLARCFETVTRLVNRVPSWNLCRRQDWAAVPDVVTAITELVEAG